MCLLQRLNLIEILVTKFIVVTNLLRICAPEDAPDMTEGNPIEPSAEDQDADNESSDTETSTSTHLAEEQMESNSQRSQPFFHSKLKSARRKMKVVEPVFIPYRRRKRA